jgi:hypothetical protein
MLVIWANDPERDIILTTLQHAYPKLPFTGYFDGIPDPAKINQVPFVSELPMFNEFEEKYMAKFHHPIIAYGPYAFDTLHLLVSIFESSPNQKLQGRELKKTITNLQIWKGVSGKMRITQEGLIKVQPVLKIYESGKLQAFEKAIH